MADAPVLIRNDVHGSSSSCTNTCTGPESCLLRTRLLLLRLQGLMSTLLRCFVWVDFQLLGLAPPGNVPSSVSSIVGLHDPFLT